MQPSAASFNDLDASHKFQLDVINEWNLRLGNLGSPVIPGDMASAKVAIIAPGVEYDFFSSLAAASNNEASLFRSAAVYGNGGPEQKLRYEMGTFKNVRFVTAPSDTYGVNPCVLYNAGKIAIQYTVANPINAGDGSPDPDPSDPGVVPVDGTWYIGQKNVTHYIQLESDADMSNFALNDMVSIHTSQTNAFGVSGGVNFLDGQTIVRRVVFIDTVNKRLSFDRPISYPYTTDLGGGVYAYVTKGTHVAFTLVLGSRGGIVGNVNRPLRFYEPKPVDDFDSVYRFVWDIVAGYNIWSPTLFECHFSAVSLPKPGGVISPAA